MIAGGLDRRDGSFKQREAMSPMGSSTRGGVLSVEVERSTGVFRRSFEGEPLSMEG